MRIYSSVLLVGLVATALVAGCDDAAAPVATTTGGRYEGTSQDGVLAFLGIRYAQAPVGELRWKPPVPVTLAEGLMQAKAFAAQPPQLPDVEEGASTLPQDEDCLYANVWTPSMHGKRPVLVFLHGGGWVNGGTADPWYYGAHLADRGDMVVVTLDYRLGPLGFLDLSAVGGADYASSGNLGVLDMIAALRWVQENVAAFGGDPDDVTLMGQSAGSMSVALLMALPEARGLFHRAIAESGALNLIHTQATARATTQQFMQYAGVTDLAGLRALTVDQIMAAEAQLEASTSFSDLLFGPVLDGTLVKEPPLQAIARGDAADIPLLTGTTLDETKYWYFYFDWLKDVGPRAALPFLPFITSLFTPAEQETLIAGYEARYPSATPGDITMKLATDALFRQGQIRFAEAQAAHQPNTYMYLFAWQTPILDGLYGAPHAVELPFLFRTFGQPSVDDFVGTTPPLALSDAMEEAWFSFIRTGVPRSAHLPTWPAYDSTSRSTMVFDTASAVEADPYGAERQAWSAFPFDSVVPSL